MLSLLKNFCIHRASYGGQVISITAQTISKNLKRRPVAFAISVDGTMKMGWSDRCSTYSTKTASSDILYDLGSVYIYFSQFISIEYRQLHVCIILRHVTFPLINKYIKQNWNNWRLNIDHKHHKFCYSTLAFYSFYKWVIVRLWKFLKRNLGLLSL